MQKSFLELVNAQIEINQETIKKVKSKIDLETNLILLIRGYGFLEALIAQAIIPELIDIQMTLEETKVERHKDILSSYHQDYLKNWTSGRFNNKSGDSLERAGQEAKELAYQKLIKMIENWLKRAS